MCKCRRVFRELKPFIRIIVSFFLFFVLACYASELYFYNIHDLRHAMLGTWICFILRGIYHNIKRSIKRSLILEIRLEANLGKCKSFVLIKTGEAITFAIKFVDNLNNMVHWSLLSMVEHQYMDYIKLNCNISSYYHHTQHCLHRKKKKKQRTLW